MCPEAVVRARRRISGVACKASIAMTPSVKTLLPTLLLSLLPLAAAAQTLRVGARCCT